MVLSLVVMRIPGSFTANLRLMLVAVVVAALVPLLAAAMHALRGWRRLIATVAMNLVVAALLLATSAPVASSALVAILMECSCEWWNFICCLI